MPDEFATQTAQGEQLALAESAESAPATEEILAEGAESAPAEGQQPEGSETPERAGSEPAQAPEAVEELKKTRKRAQTAEQERDFWREQALKGQQQPQQAPSQQQAQEPQQKQEPAPKLEDFGSFDDYQAAHNLWLENRAAEKAFQRLKQEQEQQTKIEAVSRLERDYQQRFNEAVKRDPELPEKLSGWKITQHPAVIEAIKVDEFGPEIAGFIATNPEEAMRLSQLPPIAAVIEIGKIGAKIKMASTPPTPQKKVSQAPEPISPIARSVTNTERDDSKMSIDEYINIKNAEDRAKGRLR